MKLPAQAPGPAWRLYVALFCGLSALLIGAVSALNYLVDPYLLHQWDTPQVQRMGPTLEKLSAWGKTYALARLKPAVVYIGNSRTELGLPTRAPMFEDKVVFNAGLSGASVGDMVVMANYAARVSQLDTVVWGIDASSFSMVVGSVDLRPELVAQGPFFFARRALFDLRRGVSVDMTRDSLKLLSGSYGQVCRSSLAFYGQRDDDCVKELVGDWTSAKRAMTHRLEQFSTGSGPSDDALQAFSASVGALCQAGTRVRVYINPTHALTVDSLYWAGKWAAMERWQADLALLGERQRATGCDVRLYDFSGFNSITTETIPQISLSRHMDHFWEASHYRSNVGRMILARMFGGQGAQVPDDFGVELTTASLPAHLAAVRAARDRYHRVHRQETELIKSLTRLAPVPG